MIDPADPRVLEGLLARHRLRPNHRLGQNFLVDAALRDAVAEAAGAGASDQVLEVGAGPGTLTVALAGRCARLVALELDRRFLPILRTVLGAREEVEVVVGDVLRIDIEALFPAGDEIVVGNIPYYLTGALLRRLLDRPPRPRRLSLVMQREVAERITAPGGWSLASVAVQVFAEPRLVMHLPAAAFSPRPAVDSALVVMDVRPRPAVDVPDLDAFFRFVEAVFQFRRKQLGAALPRVTGLGPAEAVSRLQGIGVEPSRRAETLSLEEWEAVHRTLAL